MAEAVVRLEVEDRDDVAGPDVSDAEEVVGLDDGVAGTPVGNGEVVGRHDHPGPHRAAAVPCVRPIDLLAALRGLHDGERLTGGPDPLPPDRVVPVGDVHAVEQAVGGMGSGRRAPAGGPRGGGPRGRDQRPQRGLLAGTEGLGPERSGPVVAVGGQRGEHEERDDYGRCEHGAQRKARSKQA